MSGRSTVVVYGSPHGGGADTGARLAPTPHWLHDGLAAAVGEEQVLTRPLDLARYASDASPYRMVPRAVVVARDGADIAAVLGFADRHMLPVTFRAAGTSLNGQAQGDGILVDVRRHFAAAVAEDGGRFLRARPGIVVSRANALLARYGRMLGPDPASSSAATVGGVVANNASGMSCGTERNSYRTVRSMRVVLASGTVVDTADPDADRLLAEREPELVAELLAIKRELEADPVLSALIRKKFAIKNTNGYRLDAFLDAARPSKILRGLMVGSQGTLGFLDEIVFETVPFGRLQTTALLRFPGLDEAVGAVPALVAAGAHAVELMDAPSLLASKHVDGAPPWLSEVEEDAALLVECRAADDAALTAFEETVSRTLAGTGAQGAFTRDAAAAGRYWKVRKGLLAALGGSRPAGTVLLGEDVCVPPPRVAEAARDLRKLLDAFGFHGSVAGHAADGNLHFTMTFDAASQSDVDRYRECMQAVANLILDEYDGALKGEHATGRNMAPFVEQEWGPKATALMRRVKAAFDPHGILNPGVLLNDDPHANVKHLKTMPSVSPKLDACIECGFCEPVCPSRDLTTTPRQRIALQREIARRVGEPALARELADDYAYDAVDTCAADSSCQTACPVDIDTGSAMKDLRRRRHGPGAERAALHVARRFAAVECAARLAVLWARRIHRWFGPRPLRALTGLGRRVLGPELMPAWIDEIPNAAPRKLPRTVREGARAVYVPACVNRIFGTPATGGDMPLVEAVVRVSARANRPVWIPDGVRGACCSTIWQSKGYAEGSSFMANDLVDRLWTWSDRGRLPVVFDASSCTLGAMREIAPHLDAVNAARHRQLDIRDAVDWARTELVPHLPSLAKTGVAVVHPTCSMHQLDGGRGLADLASALAHNVVEPAAATCCGFAGDRGLLHTELTESATREEAAEVAAVDADVHLSGNRTCEIGLHHATGRAYESVLGQLERASRPDASSL
ncbi:FAD-binding and (Fe-S)-binding domain-containing protein [Glycomyces sp. NPDC048151]|uniref:FAD-binding and (Fe-S)-binding domain-containing protein n=1 Tax=Glycomyces sp. NPDC048151 TaxID=3364002 RepID=UPI00371CFD16